MSAYTSISTALDNASTEQHFRSFIDNMDVQMPQGAPERHCKPRDRRPLRLEVADTSTEMDTRAADGRRERHKLKIARAVARKEAQK